MNLKLKRNLPTLLLLLAFLTLLSVSIGDQRVVAYSLPTEVLQIHFAALFDTGSFDFTAIAEKLPSLSQMSFSTYSIR